MTRSSFGNEMPAVFPDWSPYTELDSAARAYLRDQRSPWTRWPA